MRIFCFLVGSRSCPLSKDRDISDFPNAQLFSLKFCTFPSFPNIPFAFCKIFLSGYQNFSYLCL